MSKIDGLVSESEILTICDMVRSRNSLEMQDFTTALKTYIRRKDKDLNRLMSYAERFHVDKLMKKYMEVLLQWH